MELHNAITQAFSHVFRVSGSLPGVLTAYGAVSSLRASVAAAVATSTVIGWSYAGHSAVVPLIARDLGLDDVQIGLLATALFLAASLTMLAAGDIADRYPPKLVNLWGVALVIAGTAAMALAPGYELLLGARFVSGVGAGLGLLGGLRYVARRYEEARSHFGQGLYGGGFPLGSAIALWTTPLIAAALDWRAAFWLSAIAMIAVALLWLSVPAVPRMARPGNMRDAARCPNCWWTFVQHAAGFGLVLAAGTWITIFLLREFSLPLVASGLLGSLLLVIAVVARPLGGYLVSRRLLGTIGVMRLAQLCVVAGLALLMAPERPVAVALAGAILVGFGGGIPYAAVFNTAAASLRSAPGAAQGLTALGGLISSMIGAPAMGFAIQTWGFSAAWLFLAGVSVVALLGTFLMQGEEQFAG